MKDSTVACPACGRANAPHKRLCLYCGASMGRNEGRESLPREDIARDVSACAPPESFCECPGCGHLVTRRMVRCLYCGVNLVEGEQTARLCPRCGGSMKTEQLVWAFIDRCTCCGGEYYDLGELTRGGLTQARGRCAVGAAI